MKKQNIVFISLSICLLALFAACRERSVPEGVVDTATMTRFLTEAYLVDSYDYVVVAKQRDSLGHLTVAAYDSLYAKYGITKAQYDTSIDYYLHNPKMLEDIHTRVLDNLRKYTAQLLAERATADSIRAATL